MIGVLMGLLAAALVISLAAMLLFAFEECDWLEDTHGEARR